MTRAEIRSLVRELVKDINSVEWDDAAMDLRINLDAQAIGRELTESGEIGYGRVRYPITTDGTDTVPILASNIHCITDMDDALYGGRCVNRKEFKKTIERWPSGVDEDGKIIYAIDYSPNKQAN